MVYPGDNELEEITDSSRTPCLILDGTANLDYVDDEKIPRVKGLIELLNQYFCSSETTRRPDYDNRNPCA